MADILTIDSDEDDDDIQVLPFQGDVSSKSNVVHSFLQGAGSSTTTIARSRGGSYIETVSISRPASPASSDTMDSPVGPKRKKAKTRRGIAHQEAEDNSESSTNQEPPREINIPIYTSQIYLLREKKKLLLAEDHMLSFVKEVDAENICPEDYSKEPVRVTRGRGKGRPKKTQDEPPPVVKNVLAISNDSDVDDDVLSPPPPPVKPVKKGRKTKKQKEQDALLRNLENARFKYEEAKRFEKLNGFDGDISIEEEQVEKEIQMKFRWRSEITRIPMRKNQRFHGVMPNLADLCSVPSKQLLLSVRDTIIKPEDTPASLGLSIADIIDCGVAIQASPDEGTKAVEEADPNLIRLQLQAKDQRSKVTLIIRKSELLCSLMEQYAEKQGLPLEKLTFKFDGETLGPEDTPEDLDLEDDYCIDVIVQT